MDYDTATNPNSPLQQILIDASDSATTVALRLTTTVTIFVHVIPVNEFPPVWADASFVPAWTSAATALRSIFDNSPVGTSVFTMQATDADSGRTGDGIITYSISSVDATTAGAVLTGYFQVSFRCTSEWFHDSQTPDGIRFLYQVDSSTGVVTVKTAGMLSGTSYSGLQFTISARDNGATPKVVADRIVLIGLTAVNKNGPVLTPSAVYSFTVLECKIVIHDTHNFRY